MPTDPGVSAARLPWQYRAAAALVALWSLAMIYVHDWRAGIVATIVAMTTAVASHG